MKKLLYILLAFCFLLAGTTLAESPAIGSVHLPLIGPDPQSPTGQKTSWSCVCFGSYPTAEVVDSAWNGVDSYALREGDLIRDDGLFARLEAAEWENGTVELDGASYVRVGFDSAPAAGAAREQHYVWNYDRPWHYFMVRPIRWRVLDIRDNRMLLLADRIPDSVPFHSADTDVTWEGCTLRSWLNGYGAEANKQGIDYTGIGFIDRAFTAAEREAILPVRCRNLENQSYGTSSGTDTEDYLFILSNEEVFEGADAGRYGFHAGRDYDDPAKRFTSTLYAKCMGAWWSPVSDYAGNSFWFMRTSGYTSRSVTYICDFGYIYSKGTLVTCSDAGVLPAMWIDLSKAEITAAGETVSSEIMRTADQSVQDCPVPDLSNPAVIPDESAPDGISTVWNAVAFGRYPQTEILKEASEKDASGTDRDAEVNPELFSVLEAAAANAGDDVVRDDVRYIRLDVRWFRCDPIIWRVLEVCDGTALLMADRCLDSVPWHSEYCDVSWEASDIRRWLNGTGAVDSPYGSGSFIETAFTEEELRAVLVSAVSNENNYYFGTPCGAGTRDRVFILSEEEVFSSDKAERYGFRPSDGTADPGRRLAPTAYAAARGAWRSDGGETRGMGFWFLRTNGYTRDNAVYAGEWGYLYNRGIPVTCADAGIVPVIRIRLGVSPVTRVEDIGKTAASAAFE